MMEEKIKKLEKKLKKKQRKLKQLKKEYEKTRLSNPILKLLVPSIEELILRSQND